MAKMNVSIEQNRGYGVLEKWSHLAPKKFDKITSNDPLLFGSGRVMKVRDNICYFDFWRQWPSGFYSRSQYSMIWCSSNGLNDRFKWETI